MSPHASQAPGDHEIVEPEFNVFLSHSGAQKDFVSQLNEDLRGRDLKPFFDKNRDCLPIGQNFPENIFKAIRGCKVGVVILSDEFFTRSHWPMIELVDMVERGVKIMPIFLGISPEDLSKQTNLDDWKSLWQGWAESGRRVKLSEWEAAVRRLRGLNGLVYNRAEGHVQFRKRIVTEMWAIVRPPYRWDDSSVQGRPRLSEILQEEIKRTKLREGGFQVVGFQVVGFHGVGGIGKTTACKSLCKDLFHEFDGRVYHLELENVTKKIQKAWLRDVLIRLTCIDKTILEDKSLDECWSLLQERVQLNKVFLAIDNVTWKSLNEAKKYLDVKYCKGSILMVTARAGVDFVDLGIDSNSYYPVPELNEEEARDLFLYYAKPKSEVDKEVLMRCVKRCYFFKGTKGSFHYHPLALQVLGSQLLREDPRDWELRLKKQDVFNQRGELENGVFDILRRSFDLLNDEDKLLFMDVALFDCEDWLFNMYRDEACDRSSHDFETSGYSDTIVDYDISRIDTGRTWCIHKWLHILHNDVDRRLEILKSKSLLEELGSGTERIQMHDLWREFALDIEACRGKQQGGRWVYELVGGKDMRSVLSSGGWTEIERICVTKNDIWDDDLKSVKLLDLSRCSNVKVFRLLDVVVRRELDLSALKQLRTLEIVSLQDPYSETRMDTSKVRGIQFLSNLTWLIWLNISVDSVDSIQEISHLSCLQVLQLKCMSFNNPLISLDLSKLIDLREVRIGISFLGCIMGFSEKMTALRILDLRLCLNLQSCSGIDSLFSLEELVLRQCKNLVDLPNLEKLTKLRLLVVQRCLKLCSIQGVGSLVALQELRVEDMPSLEELPDISDLKKLRVLYLVRCPSLKCIPGLDNLVALQELFVDVDLLINTRDFYLTLLKNSRDVSLTELSKLRIVGDGKACNFENFVWNGKRHIFLEDEIKKVQQLPVLNFLMMQSVLDLTLHGLDYTLTNLSKLTALKRLRLEDCRMENLPDMGTEMRLESLCISGCILRGWNGVRRSGSSEVATGFDWHCDWTLPYLEELKLVGDSIQLPDLSHFPRLRELVLSFYNLWDREVSSNCELLCSAKHKHLEILSVWHVKMLPELSKFLRLRKLQIRDCRFLKSLTCSDPHNALECMELEWCRLLHAPSVDLFPRLRSLTVKYCGGELNDLEVEKLKSRGFRYVDYLRSWTLERELWRDEITLESEPRCNSGAGSGLHGPEDVGGVSSGEVVPCSSEIVPHVESIAECARVPNRVILEQDLDRKRKRKDKAPME